MPLRYSASSLVRSELAPYYAFDWLPVSGSYMHVMCRSTGNTVATVEVPPFMAIHYINAYEDDADGAAVIVDCCEHYSDPAIIHTLLLHRLRSLSSDKDKDPLPNASKENLLNAIEKIGCDFLILYASSEDSYYHASWSTIKGSIYTGRMKTTGTREPMQVFVLVA
ncbi:unnamed protein product [Miscanthus lutarioriparius]|uniref:Uncharacterized protein n=1 Tax=Miscanthus lutarioriparius TaxID=422564 RepID=A0A811RGS2_9POAL|nr:unnamed protein product [Miscanthus lutarioriparius]